MSNVDEIIARQARAYMIEQLIDQFGDVVELPTDWPNHVPSGPLPEHVQWCVPVELPRMHVLRRAVLRSAMRRATNRPPVLNRLLRRCLNRALAKIRHRFPGRLLHLYLTDLHFRPDLGEVLNGLISARLIPAAGEAAQIFPAETHRRRA